MAIAFTTAPTVEPEDAITSTQLSALADAFNSRLRSGIADGTFRIHQFLFNSFRSVRYPDGTAFPSWAEFFEFYMHVDPDETPATWPLSMPNAASGANQASQMMAFVFGDLSVDPEGYRLVENFPLWAGGNPPTTPELQWIVGNRQRGAIDPDTGNQYVPAYQAAQEYFKITQLPDSFHGKSYGSFQPQAETIGDCGRNVVNRRIFYTSVVATPDTSGILNGTISTADGNTVVTYDGTCFNGTPNAQPTHVQYVSETPFAHYIFLNNGGIDRVPINDFIEGPYTQGGELKKPNGNQLTNYLNAFIHDFRGTHDERYPDNAAQQDTKDIGFSFEEFLAQQYFLSPNIGTTSGSAINPVYPQFAWIGIAEPPENDLAIHSQSATTAHQYADGFTLAVAYVQYERLSEAATVQCLVNGDVYKSFTVPEDDGEFMVTFKDVVNTPEISFRLPDGATFTDSSGYIMVDCTEQVYYRPQLHDAYLLLRLMSTEGDEDARVEGRGLDDDRANEFYERYMLTGMCKNTVAQAPVIQDVEVNNNPVYDAARRLCRENVKIVPRRELLNYEVSGGKSILYFQRHALGLSNQNVDSFKGLAPSLENITSGGITTGQSYQLRTGSIDYSGTTYNAGDIFTGAGGVKAFTDNETQTASVVREYEGVRPLAFPNGYSNEWLMFSQEKVYSHSDSNIFHPDSYSDIMAFNNRCMFYAPTHELGPNGSSGDILRHVQTGITVPVLAPEAPSGYNYLRNINEFTYTADDTKTNFYKSCPIYKPDEEIESCISYEEGGIEVVKLTFTGRIQHTDEAPATISSNHLVWDKDALALEPYRTTENAIREYIIARGGTQHCTTSMVGNTAAESTLYQQQSSGIWGACYPQFYFTRLVPSPYNDNNDTQDATDTLLEAGVWKQMSAYLRAMCEGYLDGQTSIQYACDTGNGTMFDYTFENMCNEAFDGRWFNSISTEQRADKPQGFGPLPNTITYAENFNQFSAAINLLDKARVSLPMALKCRQTTFTGTGTTAPDYAFGGSCVGAGVNKAVTTMTPPQAATSGGSTGWQSCNTFNANSFGGFNETDQCADASNWNTFSQKEILDFKMVLTDPLAMNAIPVAWRDMLETAAMGVIGHRNKTQTVSSYETVADPNDAEECCQAASSPCPFLTIGGDNFEFTATETAIINNECQLVQAGQLDPGDPAAGDFWVGRASDGSECGSGSSGYDSFVPVADQPEGFLKVPLV